MRKGWTGYCVTYDNNHRYLNSERNALLHAYSLSKSHKIVSVTVNNKLIAEWNTGLLTYLASYISKSLLL